MVDHPHEATEEPTDVAPRDRSKVRKRPHRELRVAFDTNVLFTGSASDLVRQEAANLIGQSSFPDLSIQWYLPEVVRLERQYQMQTGALQLLGPLARVEKLLGHNLNITEGILVERVEKVVTQRQKEIGLITLKPDYASLDWERLVHDSVFRRPPFQDGKTEKGFRDALVVESFVHLVDVSPKTPKVCRVALVTADELVAEAVRARVAGSANAKVLGSLEELRGLINTLISEVDEAFIESLRPKAARLFFADADKSTLYYKDHVSERLTEKFKVELGALPAGATSRTNGTWQINAPNFAKKAGQRIHWTSRIELDIEARKLIREQRTMVISKLPTNVGPGVVIENPKWIANPSSLEISTPNLINANPMTVVDNFVSFPNLLKNPYEMTVGGLDPVSTRVVTTHNGMDVYDVLWRVDVTTALDLRRATVDDIQHGETVWEAAT